ncbi:response regulator transcription factor [Paraconexibacter algicola]|uniref:DNA-binding response regulator n=1 Tax=Paraconexibacter algicola TaxID=2133960 RepID=A0A2T4UKJ7_9ACTN|nr:response regulator transcription factor [Paraconexibacter algicola]PTL59735.1 DNA-binding response regulator [Paraconexibacter algicola]
MRTILVVEDDARIGALVRAYLERDGFATVWARSGDQARAELPRHRFDLALLDLGLPDVDGLVLCRELADRLPVIVVSARDEESDRVAGLELGADDYVTKPFSPRELTARVRAVLRRGERAVPTGHGTLDLGVLRIDVDAHEARVDDHPIALTAREFELLTYLARQRGRVVGRDELLEAVWGYRSPGQTRTVDVHVAQLRARLGVPDLIRTVRGVGYKLVVP